MSIQGTLKVSNDCIADLAGYAALSCYGVVGMAEIDPAAGVVQLLPSYRLRKGIDVLPGAGELAVHLHVVVESGVHITSVVNNLTSAVKYSLATIAQLDPVSVTVHVEGIRSSK